MVILLYYFKLIKLFIQQQAYSTYTNEIRQRNTGREMKTPKYNKLPKRGVKSRD